jgi:hypothetical protein
MTRSIRLWIAACALVTVMAWPASGYVIYDTHVHFLEALTKDVLKLMPRAMGSYIFQNRYDFMRGMTFMTRDIQFNPGKLKDLEEIRREAYERLMRDIPYCVQAFKGGEIKLDTAPANLAGRLGMIAYSISLLKMPDFPDVEYLERFSMVLDEVIADSQIDVFVFYDGYGDFHSLGELMERLKQTTTPSFKHVRNEIYAGQMKEDVYAMFRPANKFLRQMTLSDHDVNEIYSNIVNDTLDAFVYIWKCSGMDLAHPSYAAPPGTVISRPSRRRAIAGGILSRPPLPAPPPAILTEEAPLTPESEETGPPQGEFPPLPATSAARPGAASPPRR